MAHAETEIESVVAHYVTQAEAAAMLNLHPSALRARVYRGAIASVKIGSAVLVPITEIDRVRRTYMPDGVS